MSSATSAPATAIAAAPMKAASTPFVRLGSGIVNTSYQVGSALGLAAMTALATSRGADQVGDPRRCALFRARGYSTTQDELAQRLTRIEGQVRGFQRMVDDERYCIDLLTQISAIHAALDKFALGLLDDHAHNCVIGAQHATLQADPTEELMATVGRLMRSG